jgi:hypothetical protein
VRGAGKKRSRTSGARRGLLVGLLAGGALLGAAGALKSYRNRSLLETNESQSVDRPIGDERSVRDSAQPTEDRRADDTVGPVNTSSGRAAKKAST